MLHFLNDIAYGSESTKKKQRKKKNENYIIIASLKSETMGNW